MRVQMIWRVAQMDHNRMMIGPRVDCDPTTADGGRRLPLIFSVACCWKGDVKEIESELKREDSDGPVAGAISGPCHEVGVHGSTKQSAPLTGCLEDQMNLEGLRACRPSWGSGGSLRFPVDFNSQQPATYRSTHLPLCADLHVDTAAAASETPARRSNSFFFPSSHPSTTCRI